MSNIFSPSLTLAGMDYIAPSSVCIKPAVIQSASGIVQRHGTCLPTNEQTSQVDPASYSQKVEVMKISLRDCLACSGCITTAEEILVQSQSRDELITAVLKPSTEHLRPLLVTISDASAASLATFMNTSLVNAMSCISGFFKYAIRPDVTHKIYVSDLRWALAVSAQLTAREYIRRCEHDPKALPLIVSSCPGWVCYCEKQGSSLLSLLSPFLSPQGIAGSLTKRCIEQQCYHVSIQPCFDKKLEAVRDGGFWPSKLHRESGGKEEKIPYTDCVLSTAELLEWMQEIDDTLPWRAPLDSDYYDCSSRIPSLSLSPTSNCLVGRDSYDNMGNTNETLAHIEGSGGYLRTAVEEAIHWVNINGKNSEGKRCIPNSSVPTLNYETKRNRNHQLVRCPQLPEQLFCVAYGFQHIQNIVRGLKKGLPTVRHYTFIEMMACPDGCLNGGGQIRFSPYTPQRHEATLSSVEKKFEEFLTTHACKIRSCARERENRIQQRSTEMVHNTHLSLNTSEEYRTQSLTTSTHQQSRQTGTYAPSSERTILPAKVHENRVLFSQERVAEMLSHVDPSALRCVFTDRKKEFEDLLSKGNVQSLKW